MIPLFLTFLLGLALFAACDANADPTWPSSVDELEDIMYLNSGFRKSGFADAVTPCGFSAAGPGRITAAEWIRTAFHDMATGNVYLGGSGGVDASIMFETGRSENIGAAFNSSLGFFASYYSTRVSMSDLIALSVYTAVRSCGGPAVAIRAGRIDATVAGPMGVPIPQNPVGVFESQFARTGFNRAEMIQMTACGHSVGGVHAQDFPEILPPGTAPNDYMAVDSTIAVFDNKVAVEWIAGNTTDPMAVGPSVKASQNSDTTVFGADQNVTMQALTDPVTFASVCKSILQRMIEVVPPNVVFTDPVIPFEVKPSELQLTLLSGGSSLSFTGLIRVRTTVRPMSQISNVQLIYLDRNGASSCGSCAIDTTFAGTSAGFDDNFTFYSFTTTIPSNSSISSFNVLITLADTTTELHDNNGAGYPVQDSVMLQSPQSCLNQVPDGNGNLNLTVVAAVRNDLTLPVNLNLTTLVPRQGVIVPALKASLLPMVAGSCVGSYSLYSVSYAIPSAQVASAKFDILSGTGSAILADAFKSTTDLTNSCAGLSLVGATCNLSPTPTSASSSLSSTISSTSSSLSSSSIASSSSSSSTSSSTRPSSSSTASSTSTGTSSTTSSSTSRTSSTSISTAVSSTSSSSTRTSTSISTSSTRTSSTSTSSSSIRTSTTSSSSTRTSTTSSSSTRTSTTSSSSSSRPSTSSSSTRTSTTSSSSTRTSSSTIKTSISSSTSKPTTSTTSTSSKLTSTTSSRSSTISSTSSTTSSSSSTTTKPSAIDSTTTSKPSQTGTAIKSNIANYTYYGCQTEATNMRALASDYTTSETMTLEACSAYCDGYLYWGAEYSQECYCGNSFNAGSIEAPSADCSMVCKGNSLEYCGGGSRLSVYALNTTLSPPAPTPAIKPTVGAYSYYGCQTEATNMRALSSAANATDSMALELCESFCTGYTYWGVEYGRECYCGNSFNAGSVTAPASDCSFLCPGNDLEFCGAGNRLSTYVLN